MRVSGSFVSHPVFSYSSCFHLFSCLLFCSECIHSYRHVLLLWCICAWTVCSEVSLVETLLNTNATCKYIQYWRKSVCGIAKMRNWRMHMDNHLKCRISSKHFINVKYISWIFQTTRTLVFFNSAKWQDLWSDMVTESLKSISLLFLEIRLEFLIICNIHIRTGGRFETGTNQLLIWKSLFQVSRPNHL